MSTSPQPESLPLFQMEELFQTADKNGDGIVTTDELAELVAVDAEK